MEIRIIQKDSFFITFSEREIRIFQKVFKIFLESISDSEFKSRTGFTKIEVRNLNSILKSHLDRYNFFKDKTKEILNETLCFSYEEVIILNQSLNEVCHGIKIVDFEKEIGAAKEFLETYLNYINMILNYEETNNVNQEDKE